MIDKWLKTLLAIVALFIFLMLCSPRVWAENPWGFRADGGFLTDTTDATAFKLSFPDDYFLDSAFSIAPPLLITPGGNSTQITFTEIA